MIAWIVLGAALVLLCIGLWSKHRVKDIICREDFRNDFYKAANVLVDDEDTPESVVDLIEKVSVLSSRPFAPYRFLRSLMRGDARRAARKPSERAKTLRDDVMQLRVPMQQKFAVAVASGALAISYNSVFVGPIIRRFALIHVSKMNSRRYTGGEEASTTMIGLTERFNERFNSHAHGW